MHVLLQGHQLRERVCTLTESSLRYRCTLHDLPCVIITDFPTCLLLEEVKLCPADGTIPVEVHPVKHLSQSLSAKQVCGWVTAFTHTHPQHTTYTCTQHTTHTHTPHIHTLHTSHSTPTHKHSTPIHKHTCMHQ